MPKQALTVWGTPFVLAARLDRGLVKRMVRVLLGYADDQESVWPLSVVSPKAKITP